MSRVFRGKKFRAIVKQPLTFFKSRRRRISASVIALFFITLIGVMLLQNLVSPPQAAAAWYNPGWNYRKQLTIDYTKVAATLTDFPILVSFTTDANLAGNAQSDGDDILFTSSDGSTKLSHEIEKFTSSTGELVAWVKIPSLSNSVNTAIYIYFGNSTISSQQSATSVWDSNFKGVWHMKENPSGAAPQIMDSTTNINNGSSAGSMTSGDLVNAKVNGGLDFDGTDDHIAMSDQNYFSPAVNNLTVSVWVNTPIGAASQGGNACGSVGKWFVSKGGSSWEWGFENDLNGLICFHTWNSTTGDHGSASFNMTVDDGQWHYYVATVDYLNQITLYIDGIQRGTDTTFSGTMINGTDIVRIGQKGDGSYYPGVIDEVKISSTARTSSWITTEYNNQNSPSTFYSTGNIEGKTSGWYNQTWTCRKSITVDYTKVSGNQTEFPMLVNLSIDAGLAAGAQDDGDDILFTYQGSKLNHEIEKFDGGTGELVAWVRVPYLSSTVNTTLYMYYCNSVTSSQQNATAVWDGNYKSVQHLEETSSCPVTFTNSKSASHSGSCGDAPAYLSGGKIGAARSFDGSNDYITVPDHADLEMGSSNFTMSSWVYTNSTINQDVFAHINDDPWPGYEFALFRESGEISFYDGNTWEGVASGISTGGWYHIVAARNGTTLTFYVNGSSVGSITVISPTPDSTSDIRYGRDNIGGKPFSGHLDELRYSLINRSSGWITTEYNNQNSPSTFYALGSEESISVGWYNNLWLARKRIKIDRSNVVGEHMDFPMLISFASDADVASLVQTDFDDIVFTSSDGTTKLNHEIEKYTYATGELVAWVKIPYLTSSVDTYIYLYYGNTGASNQQNVAGTWDGNYRGVWHMSGVDGSATLPESTSNPNDGLKISGTGAGEPANILTGITGNAQDFDGTNDSVNAGSDASLDNIFASPGGTVSFWVKLSTFADGDQLVSKGSATSSLGWNISEQTSPVNTIRFRHNATGGSGEWRSSIITTGSWFYVVLSFDKSSVANDAVFYINGVASTTEQSVPVASGNDDGAYSFRPGTHDGLANFYDGDMDEVRASNIIRSASWVQTEYNNQNSPSTFYTVSVQELNAPSSPTLIAPASGATGLTLTPSFQFRSSEQGGDYIQYEIALYESTCTTLIGGSTIQQSSNQTGWTGQDAGPGGNTAYAGNPILTSSTIASYTYQGSPALSWGTQYCWRARGKDPGGSNSDGPYSASRLFTTNNLSSAPTLSYPPSNITNVSLTPEFRFNSTDADNDYLRYRLYLYLSDCSTAVGASPYTQPSGTPQTNWAGQGTQSATAYTSGQQAIFQLPIALTPNTTYCWKADATDPGGSNTYGAMSATQSFTTRAATPQNTRIDGNVRIEGGTRISP